MFKITDKRISFLLISGIVVLISLIFLGVFGLKRGVEFSSGSMLTVKFEQAITQEELEQVMTELGYSQTIVQQTQPTGNFLIRTHELTEEEQVKLTSALQARLGNFSGDVSVRRVSSMIASETSRSAVIAVIIAAAGILFYVTWAFRRMPRPFHYGSCAIVALIHDAVIPVGIFAIMGRLLNWEINLMFITGVLAVVGYSVNDTVVIFDRIRENLILGVSNDFETVVNKSLVETMARSLNTAMTTLITLVALFFFVGATIQNFIIVLIIGIVAGTYSSIFIAPMLLIVWDKREWRQFPRRLLFRQAKAG